MTAADCGCQPKGDLVYAIGDLDIDFESLARLDSLQQNADGFLRGGRRDVTTKGHFIRHLLGWREILTSPAHESAEEEEDKKGTKPPREDKKGTKPPRTEPTIAAGTEKIHFHRPHLYDAQAVIWVLRQDESPVYAIRPSGPYAEDAYLELICFLMEQHGYQSEDTALHQEKNKAPAIYYPSLDTLDGTEPNRTTDSRGRPVRLVERVAIPGTLDGMVTLFNGSVVPVICPDMRGTRSWTMEKLVEQYVKPLSESSTKEEREAQRAETRNLERLAQRFFEEARNPGRSPEERALNFAATQTFRSVQTLRDKFGASVEWEMDDITVTPSPTCRENSECYDVETAFFDPENVLRSKIVLARTYDVSDVVPVMLGEDREYRRR